MDLVHRNAMAVFEKKKIGKRERAALRAERALNDLEAYLSEA